MFATAKVWGCPQREKVEGMLVCALNKAKEVP